MERKSKILNTIKLIYLVLIGLFLINMILLLILQKAWLLYTSLSLVGLIIILYILIHIAHAKGYVYKCPNCHEEFKISFFKDITAFNAGTEKKVLVCPKCDIKEVMEGKLK